MSNSINKQKIHSVLESMLYNVASTGKGRKAIITIPYYEIAKELGFGEPSYNLNIRLTLKAEFIGDDYEQ